MADELTRAIIIVACIDLMLFLGQIAVLDLNPDSTSVFSCKGNFLGIADAYGCQGTSYSLNSSNSGAYLPSTGSSVSPTTGNIFTDSFTTLKNWFVDGTGLGFFYSVLTAPYNFLTAIGLPNAFVFAIGSLWYLINIFLIIGWFMGR